MRENLLPDAQVYLVEDIGLRLFDQLDEQLQWIQSNSLIAGTWYPQPRLTALYGEAPYDYSGVSYNPQPWDRSEALKEARTRVQELLEMEFNGVVCNKYRDGQDSIGWHSDNEVDLGWRPVIVSLSFGATRTMSFRRPKPNTSSGRKSYEKHDIELHDGSMLVMLGKTQENWQHAVLKTPEPVGPRINLTFRILKS